jgi:dTDP-4-amino-4,6-dideoxygalactose transaminase
VHLFGLCADMDAVMAVASRHGLWVLEDAACGFGARIRGQHAGTFGTFGCFSFHPRKAITTGEGGMVTTADDQLDTAVRSLRDHGASRSDFARHHAAASYLLPEYNVVGFNFRMTDIQGALGSVQMDRAAMLLAERQRQARFYDERLRAVPSLRTPITPDGYEHGYQSYVCLYAPEEPTLANVDALHAQRNALMTSLEEQGIATRQGTHAPVLTGFYAQKYHLTREQFPRACIAERLSLSLPIYAQLTDEELELVCGALQQVAHA